MSFRRMLPFLLLNIVVSAGVVLGILSLWGRSQECNCEPVAISALSDESAIDPTAAAIDEILSPGGNAAVQTPDVAITPESADECDVTHEVQPGESLGVISVEYDVPIDDIIAATDGLDDPNLLFVGQLLTIPVCGLEAIATESPTVTPVPTLALVTGGSDTEISIADVLNVGDLSVEQALIVNTGADAIVLAGWTLSDESELVYTFGDVTIFGEGAGITVHSGLGEDNIPDLYWKLTTPAWQSGETATLRDADGNVQAVFVIP
ncbi:MAG: lamin tail domain-containing protein [Anaerolineae bacterium]|nr:lamin tail domain-containing protein [Anaerolineae bacterium]MCO5191902.1 lamin tail domain-containing protein [Anaerolineae bacterium]MCO5197720.1 lamin tail domain-containing protein [Anaerolineae bacterium]MCO5206645.1 lamin tail domain-containing protein [Anaerolineae bacterium]